MDKPPRAKVADCRWWEGAGLALVPLVQLPPMLQLLSHAIARRQQRQQEDVDRSQGGLNEPSCLVFLTAVVGRGLPGWCCIGYYCAAVAAAGAAGCRTAHRGALSENPPWPGC